jgi:hypothetical protein
MVPVPAFFEQPTPATTNAVTANAARQAMPRRGFIGLLVLLPKH